MVTCPHCNAPLSEFEVRCIAQHIEKAVKPSGHRMNTPDAEMLSEAMVSLSKRIKRTQQRVFGETV